MRRCLRGANLSAQAFRALVVEYPPTWQIWRQATKGRMRVCRIVRSGVLTTARDLWSVQYLKGEERTHDLNCAEECDAAVLGALEGDSVEGRHVFRLAAHRFWNERASSNRNRRNFA